MKRVILFAVVVALMAAAPAYASNASRDEFGGPASAISNLSSGHSKASDPSRASDPSHGSLPFTGFDVALLAFGGVALVGVGMGVRRLSRPLA